jgi:hypothetical protein
MCFLVWCSHQNEQSALTIATIHGAKFKCKHVWRPAALMGCKCQCWGVRNMPVMCSDFADH